MEQSLYNPTIDFSLHELTCTNSADFLWEFTRKPHKNVRALHTQSVNLSFSKLNQFNTLTLFVSLCFSRHFFILWHVYIHLKKL